MGWFNIHAAGYDPEHPSLFDISQESGKQFLWIVTALVLGGVILLMEGEFLQNMAYPVYLTLILLLVAVLLFGKEVNGARSWFGVGGVGIQPSEFAKPATALAIAQFLSTLNIRVKDLRTKLVAGVLILIPAALIMLQPDTGTTLVFAAFLLVLYREGLSGNVLLVAFLAVILAVLTLLMRETIFPFPFMEGGVQGHYGLIGIVSLLGALVYWAIRSFSLRRYRKRAYLWLAIALTGSLVYIVGIDLAFDKILDAHQQTRVQVLLGILEDPQGAGYNVNQSKTAIGSGGFWGKGYLEGTLTKYKYVPMQSTDFIFCTIGEEWGFVGSFVIVALFVALILRVMIVAERQRAVFTRVYGYCVASILFLHVLINVGMAIGLAPVIGIPLPFFSYGGSSLWAFTILLFIFLRLDAERLAVLR